MTRSEPRCVAEGERMTFKPVNDRASWDLRFKGSRLECIDNCSRHDFVVWNYKSNRCYCWFAEDGEMVEQDRDSWTDILFDMRDCHQ